MDSNPGGTTGAVDRGSGGLFGDRFEGPTLGANAFARFVLERTTYGPRPADLDAFLALGSTNAERLTTFVDAQLDWTAIDDTELEQRLADVGYQTVGKSVAQLWAEHVRGDMSSGSARYLPVAEAEAVRIMRAVYSDRQLYEMMVEFWHDHFSVFGWDFGIAPVFMHYDRDVIRPEALGNFRTLLEGVARATAMLIYLDNASNRAGGYNENWARELLELHTLGSDVYFPGATHGQIDIGDDGLAVGYSDADVYDVARCFTGWTIRNGHWEFPDGPEYDTGEHFYYANWHEGGSKFVLGNWIGPLGQLEAELAMDFLCMHRQTARHLCAKLCRRFVDDEPPPDLVESAADVWQDNWQATDQIALVVRHILTSDAFVDAGGAKVRRPFEMLTAAFRQTGAQIEVAANADWNPYGELITRLRQTGHGCFRWPAPDGYPDTAARWTSASVMGQTWRLISRLPEMRRPDDSDFLLQIHALTIAGLPDPGQRTAAGLVDFWLERLIGDSISAGRRQELIDFLRQNAAADEALDIVSDQPDGSWGGDDLSAHYTPARLRATVALIMMLPEFHRR